MAPTVQFVSKPVDPPINDGTKHIVVTLARSLSRYAPRVMTTRGVGSVGEGVLVDAIYDSASSYAPSLLNNLRAVKHLALKDRDNLWNFVFAPNRRSSQMGRMLSFLRGVKVVQTIASRPKSFDEPAQLLFGDIIVAQSRDTRERFMRALAAAGIAEQKLPRIEVIVPPLGEVRVPSLNDTNAVRKRLSVGFDVPILLYPGDLEVSLGAKRVAEAAARIVASHPTAVVVFAYRDKTERAALIASKLSTELGQSLSPERIRFVREEADILALVRTSAALLFPVDELYGKVDLPIILLEAMALGTPVIVTDEGPLAELEGVLKVQPGDALALADAAVSVIDDHGRRAGCVEVQRRTIETRFAAGRVAQAYEGLYDELLRARG